VLATAVLEDRLRDLGFARVAGVDEAGRGALAGPLVAAAVILPPECPIEGLADSKLLTRERREELAVQIREVALAITVVRASPDTIDRTGLQRTNLALNAKALRLLPDGFDYGLADGFPLAATLPGPVLGIRKGDQVVSCVAAASIIPGYGFQRHKGYGTDEHWTALRKLGPSAYHRFSFAGVAAPWALERRESANEQVGQEGR
jgi:ribonuclease HII